MSLEGSGGHRGVGWVGDGRFKRERTYGHLWLSHVDVWQKPAQCCKANISQFKKKIWQENETCFQISVPKYNKIVLSQGEKKRQWGEYINLCDSLEYTIESAFFWRWWVLCSQCYFNEYITLLREKVPISWIVSSLIIMSGASVQSLRKHEFSPRQKWLILLLPTSSWTYFCLDKRSVKFLCKGPHSKYFRLCGPDGHWCHSSSRPP